MLQLQLVKLGDDAFDVFFNGHRFLKQLFENNVGTGVRMLVSSGRDFNLGRATDTLDRLIRRRYKLKYFVMMGLFSKSDQPPLGHTL